jgi:hypothetical protein
VHLVHDGRAGEKKRTDALPIKKMARVAGEVGCDVVAAEQPVVGPPIVVEEAPEGA